MQRIVARGGQAVAAATAAAILAGCQFAVVPPKKHPASPLRDPYGARMADAPALVTQCAVDHAGLRPGASLGWFSGGQVTISQTNASNFTTWWQTHSKPGPYRQTFHIAGHPTHYLEFGTIWRKRGGSWVPAHTGDSNPQALQYSLAAWANWTAANDRLPALVCGRGVTARQLQDQVYGTATANPW